MIIRNTFLGIYILLSAIHLFGCIKHNSKIRNYTKPLLLPALCAFYLSGGGSDPVVVALIATSWLGDVLLMVKGMKWFVAGGISFFATHVLLVVRYIPYIRFSWQSVCVIILYLIIGFGLLKSITTCIRCYLPKENWIMFLVYLSMNATMNLFAALMAVSGTKPGAGLILLGSLLFLASDSLLFLVRFDKKVYFYGQHFNVMLTYTLAKLFIVMGFMA